MIKDNFLTHKLVNTVCAFADAHQLIPQNSSIVVGFSGGPDSVFLLHLLKALAPARNLTLYAAHLNHEWRGKEAEEDAAFCKKMAEELGIPYIQARMTDLPDKPIYDGSREAQGRVARRQFLTMVQQKAKATHIALAHHADDQQETFFIRLIRGTSLAGLVGMAPRAEQYIRPLLCAHKHEILEFLAYNNIPYRIDSSNGESDYLLNRIRMNVIPALKTADDRFDHSFQHTLERLQETEDYLRNHTAAIFQQLAVNQNNKFIIDKEKFLSLHQAIQERILVYWLCAERMPFPPSHGFLHEMIKFIDSPHGGTHQIHHAWGLTKKGNSLTLVTQ
jgi:tRNA(Ile)-lysidine synthase